MNDAKIDKMVAEIIKEVDYDIYKEVFVYPEDDEEEKAELENTKERLREIVRKYL